MNKLPQYNGPAFVKQPMCGNQSVELVLPYGIRAFQGRKFLAWFSFYDEKHVCYIFETDARNRIIKYSISNEITVVDKLFLNTLFCGVIVSESEAVASSYSKNTEINAKNNISSEYDTSSYIIEDVYYYCGFYVEQMSYGEKLGYMKDFMKRLEYISVKFIRAFFQDGKKKKENSISSFCKKMKFFIPQIKITSENNFSKIDKSSSEVYRFSQNINLQCSNKIVYPIYPPPYSLLLPSCSPPLSPCYPSLPPCSHPPPPCYLPLSPCSPPLPPCSLPLSTCSPPLPPCSPPTHPLTSFSPPPHHLTSFSPPLPPCSPPPPPCYLPLSPHSLTTHSLNSFSPHSLTTHSLNSFSPLASYSISLPLPFITPQKNNINSNKIKHILLETPPTRESEDMYKNYTINKEKVFNETEIILKIPFIKNIYKPQYKCSTVFKVMANIEPDIYSLYALDNNRQFYFYDIAHVGQIKTSIFMNSIFRNIRENKNIDYIEESDNEEDFEDISEDKYVDLQHSYLIECIFNIGFKRWTPIRVVKNISCIHISRL